MSRINWTQVGVFAAVVLVVFVVGILLLPLVFGWYGGSWTMGPGMMGVRTEGGWCPVCGGTGRYSGGLFGGAFAWVFMVMTFLFPVGLLALLIVGVVWVARAVVRSPDQTQSSSHMCPKCGAGVEVDWRACPFCREDLERLG